MNRFLAVPALLAALAMTLVGVPAAAQTSHTVDNGIVVESFDGTPIVGNLFLPAGAADGAHEAVLITHGWGGSGQATIGGFVETLLNDGYIVFTWDQRGFGCSGGTVQVDHNQVEGRDVSAIIDWLVANVPQLRLEDGDPVIGMNGGSYAGGIQTAAASVDDRIDAITPEISWVDLRYSLFGGGVPNVGWSLLLYGAGLATATGIGLDPTCPAGPQTGTLAPEISQALIEGSTLTELSESSQQFFAERSLAWYGAAERSEPMVVDIPTLVINGSVDTLFDLTDGAGIFHHVRATGAPAEYIAFCGGHVACPASYTTPDVSDGEYVDAAVLAWFQRWLRGDTSVDTGPVVEYRTNAGVWKSADNFDEEMDGVMVASGSADGLPALPVLDTSLSLTNAVPGDRSLPFSQFTEVAEACGGPIEIVGLPRISGSLELTGTETHLFFRLIHREADEAINLQESAIRMTGSGDFDLLMSGVAYTIPEGDHLDLEVSTSSAMHRPITGASISSVDWELRIPMVASSLDTVCGAEVVPTGGVSGGSDEDPPAQPDGGSGLPATGGGLAALGLMALAVGAAAAARFRNPFTRRTSRRGAPAKRVRP